MKVYKTIDLFAGVGGIRLGFESEGFQTVFANDFEPACKFTYDLNFENISLHIEDIRNLSTDDLPSFDILLGGFPCQPFSIAGYRQGFKDEKDRGNLFFKIAEIIEIKKPTAFLLENVKNLYTHDKGNTYNIIYNTLTDLGYHVTAKVMNSMEFGNVPQNRERVYIVGFKNRKPMERFAWPQPVNLNKRIEDILEKRVDDKYYYENKPLFNKLKDFVTEHNQVYQWRRKYVRKNMRGVSPTLTANMGEGGHNVPIILDNKGIRKLTPKECFRLQGFPSYYSLPKNISDAKLYKQAGNSVTVTVIKSLAKNMLLALNSKEIKGKVVKKNVQKV